MKKRHHSNLNYSVHASRALNGTMWQNRGRLVKVFAIHDSFIDRSTREPEKK